MCRHSDSSMPLSKLKIRQIIGAWQLWQTGTTWYLWRSPEPIPVEY